MPGEILADTVAWSCAKGFHSVQLIVLVFWVAKPPLWSKFGRILEKLLVPVRRKLVDAQRNILRNEHAVTDDDAALRRPSLQAGGYRWIASKSLWKYCQRE